MLPRIKKKLIFLTGFMGSGKSTIGQIMANKIGYGFVDIDKQVEELTKLSISDIFVLKGEKYFREIERKTLEKISRYDHYIVALGGGTILNPTNLKLIKSNGVLIYLKADVENLFNRLRKTYDRPILLTKDGKNLNNIELRKKIQEILQTREPYYQMSHYTIDTSNKNLNDIVDETVNLLKIILNK